MKKNILVFPCGTEIANEIINSLEDNKYFELFFASSVEKSFCSFRSKPISQLPFVDNEGFLDDLKKLLEENSIDYIIPAHDDVAYALSRIEGIGSCKVIGQSSRVNDIVRFKDKTYEFFKNELPIADIYEDIKTENFPVFVKPIKGQGAYNAYSLEDMEAYTAFFSQHNRDEFIVMEELTGDEFTIDCFSDCGEVLYAGARTREKTTKGISVITSFISDQNLNHEFEKYADIISSKLGMHGIWFFQMKYDKSNNLKLLEIGPRIPGSMVLNRARGINFAELAIYQAIGMSIKVVYNNIDISLGRALTCKFKHNIDFDSLYIDFDDTLFLDEKRINSKLIRLIFDFKNKDKKVYLITKNTKNNLTKTLHCFGITNIFDDIIHLRENELKVDYMNNKSLLIDDSFQERKVAIDYGHYAYGIDSIDVLLDT